MRVIVESPFKNEDNKLQLENVIYLNMVSRHLTLAENLNPLFFHSFFTQFLNDRKSEERKIGLDNSFEHHDQIKCRIITIDRGISEGMIAGMLRGFKVDAYPVFYSLDPKTNSDLDYINNITCSKKRWEAGLDFCNGLKLINKNGDFTCYRNHTTELRKEIISIMNEFFNYSIS